MHNACHALLRSQNPSSKTNKHPGFGSKEPVEDVQEFYVSISLLAALCYRGDRRIALLLVLPAIQITCYAAIVGGDMKDVKLLNTNRDNCKYCSYWYMLALIFYFGSEKVQVKLYS